MYEAIKALKGLISDLECRSTQHPEERANNSYIIAELKEAIDSIEKDLARIQEGSYIF